LRFLDAKFGSLEDAISHTILESKLRYSSIVKEIPLFANLSYVGRMSAQVMSAEGVTAKDIVVMKFPQEQTEEQRLESFKTFITSLEKSLERDDYIVLEILL